MIRSLAGAAAAIPLTSSAKKPIRIEDCQEAAARIAAMMHELSGGIWKISIQPDFVLISQEKTSRRHLAP